MKIVPVVLAVLMFVFFLFLRGEGRVSGSDARALVARGALLVDVRTKQEFSAGHIQGAVNIPVQNLEDRMSELGAKDTKIVVYCRSGNRSSRARRMLVDAGYLEVEDMGAMTRW